MNADWGQFGLVGLICGAMLGSQLWFMRHLVTFTFPEMTKTFAAEIKEERDVRRSHHAENRLDQQRIFDRIERVEATLAGVVQEARTTLATAEQATRHRVMNLEMGMNGVSEILRQIKEQMNRWDRTGDREPRRRHPPAGSADA